MKEELRHDVVQRWQQRQSQRRIARALGVSGQSSPRDSTDGRCTWQVSCLALSFRLGAIDSTADAAFRRKSDVASADLKRLSRGGLGVRLTLLSTHRC
jgi:hypothetical protein